jgi:hypothetical protein
MASMPAIPSAEEAPPTSVRAGDERRVSERPRLPATRAARLAAAHEWVLVHHAKTFEKLAK